MLSATTIALLAAACGGGSSDAGPAATTPAATSPAPSAPAASAPAPSAPAATTPSGQTPAATPSASRFTTKARWEVAAPADGQSTCFDFDANQVVADCAGPAWDLKLSTTGRSSQLWTHSADGGRAGTYGGPFDHDWATLSTWTDATKDPQSGALPSAVYAADGVDGAFSATNDIATAAFEYGLKGDHLLYPNYRVFLVTSDSRTTDATGTAQAPVFALQVTGYYGGASGIASGWPTLRWIDRRAPGTVRELQVDATDPTKWHYIDLTAGQAVDVAQPWHVAVNRYQVRINGGASGTGTGGALLARTPAGLYDAAGAPVAAAILAATPQSTLADLQSGDLKVPAKASDWKVDKATSPLNPAPRGTYPAKMDYGWYEYFPTVEAATAAGITPAVAHSVRARPDRAALVRSASGDSYARMHMSELRTAATGAQTWVIDFDVQPAAR